MEVTPRSRLLLRALSTLYLILLLVAVGTLAWLSNRYSVRMDWSASGRNTLSAASQELISRIQGPIRITAYAREIEVLRTRVRELIDRYRLHKRDISLTFANPDAAPGQARQLGITADGELIIEFDGRIEHVREPTERSLTNALHRLARAGERWLAYLSGHGERRLDGRANHDLGTLGEHLTTRGFNVRSLNLAAAGAVPDNTSLLVIAEPRVDLLGGEVSLIMDFVRSGGNLLWLHERGSTRSLSPLADVLGIKFVDGVIVDPATRTYGINQADMTVVTSYAAHPITQGFRLVTLFPGATGIRGDAPDGWRYTAIIRTSERAWSETGPLEANIEFNKALDTAGALDIGVAMERRLAPPAKGLSDGEAGHGSDALTVATARSQRIVVVGDGDFLSNAYLGNGGNLDLGVNIVDWLANDDSLIAIPARMAPDRTLHLSPLATGIIGLGALLVLPIALFGTGLVIWLRRRRL